MYQARRRHGLCVLDYIVTSNHIHRLVKDRGEGEIAASMRLIAGRTAQACNRRKGRKGAFWEARYHATAVETGQHRARCLVCIDLHMVRAGVVAHPSAWKTAGCHGIQSPPERYRIIDRRVLASAREMRSAENLAGRHAEWVENALHQARSERNLRWSRAIAVGSEAFVRRVHAQLGIRGWIDPFGLKMTARMLPMSRRLTRPLLGANGKPETAVMGLRENKSPSIFGCCWSDP